MGLGHLAQCLQALGSWGPGRLRKTSKDLPDGADRFVPSGRYERSNLCTRLIFPGPGNEGKGQHLQTSKNPIRPSIHRTFLQLIGTRAEAQPREVALSVFQSILELERAAQHMLVQMRVSFVPSNKDRHLILMEFR